MEYQTYLILGKKNEPSKQPHYTKVQTHPNSEKGEKKKTTTTTTKRSSFSVCF